jgi:hypothetical protein
VNRRLGTTKTGILVGVLIAVAVVVGGVAVIRLDTTGKKGSGLGKEYVYDVEDLAKVDPNLILYEESGRPISTGFADSHAIALDSQGAIYVAGDEAIRVLGDNGDLLDEIELMGTPLCLAVADDGKIYAGVTDHVEVYDRRGKRLASWESAGEKAVLTSIAVRENNVFVADAGNRVIIRYDLTGEIINHIGKKDPERNVPGLVVPSPHLDLAAPRDRLLRVVNPGRHRIEAYTYEGDLEFWWGKRSPAIEGFCGCCNPASFAILSDGSFVTCEKGLTRVKIYDADGAFVGVVAGPEQLVEGGAVRICYYPADCQAGGFDVAVDASGRIFVLDTIKHVVRIFARGPKRNKASGGLTE